MAIETYFSVAVENEAAAIEHLAKRGFPPARVDYEKGETVLVFVDIPDDQVHDLAQALPIHLSNKFGVVIGSEPPPGWQGDDPSFS